MYIINCLYFVEFAYLLAEQLNQHILTQVLLVNTQATWLLDYSLWTKFFVMEFSIGRIHAGTVG